MRTNLAGNETKGEKTLYYRFRDKLDENYHIWHGVYLSMADTEIDFVILHPAEGIYVLEVKDWLIHQIQSADQKRVFLAQGVLSPNNQNPVDQARQNSYEIRNGLIKDPRMVHKEGRHKDQLVVPVNSGVVFSNISYSDIQGKGLEISLPLNKILDSEFVTGKYFTERDIEIALKKLRGKAKFQPNLEQDQWDAINEFLGTPKIKNPSTDETIGVFDSDQEKLVKFKIDKQIMIEGPAGSGKSMILVKRALRMQELYPEWKIGVFCFNALMANYLQTLFDHEDHEHSFYVSHFDGINLLRVDDESLDAIFIDEGQDASEKHLLRIIGLLKNKNSPFTIFYDNRQALYGRNDLRQLLQNVNIQVDNEKELVHQQRSVHVLAALAFHTAMINKEKPLAKIIPEVLKIAARFFKGFNDPVSAINNRVNRHFTRNNQKETNQLDLADEVRGRIFLLKKENPYRALEDFIEVIKEKTEKGEAEFRDFMIIYPTRWFIYPIRSSIKNKLSDFQIPFRIIDSGRRYEKNGLSCAPPEFKIVEEDDNRQTADLNENVVHAMTVYQAKGLDARYLAILGFENIYYSNEDNQLESLDEQAIGKVADLGYVALTRAKELCYVYYENKNQAVELLEDVLENL